MSGLALHEPHHDGSGLYLPKAPQALGDEVVVRLRVPHGTTLDHVVVRHVEDGEPRIAHASVDEETETDIWWRASFRAVNPHTNYRFLLSGGDLGYAWLTGAGIVGYDVPDADDFVVAVGAGGPDWHLDSVIYEIFPDRFASSGCAADTPGWALRRDWDTPPDGSGAISGRELYGGDLAGVEAHLDHVEALGANAVYLTPFFPAGSAHRYDAVSFDRVDPLLGGDAALASLLASAHARGMHVVGDLTLNHCGAEHEWFRAALADPSAPEHSFFTWNGDGYESWLGVASMPKFDHRSEDLSRRLFGGPDSVARRWLEGPDGLDGWRIDVANMAGRLGDVDVTHDVARRLRAAVEAAHPGGIAIAEHSHDPRFDLFGDGWHGVMNYTGFLRPAWCWLRSHDLPVELLRSFLGLPVAIPLLSGEAAVETMRRFRAGVPWPAVLHSWLLLDSHDTARFGAVAGSRERHLVGVGLQMTTPGVPMVWAGDEIGLGGLWGEDARRTMPWEHPETWDRELLEGYRRLIALRRSSDALARGGMRYVAVAPDAIAYLRETPTERVLCLASRSGHEPIRVPLAALGCAELEALTGDDAIVHDGSAVLGADGPAFTAWRLR